MCQWVGKGEGRGWDGELVLRQMGCMHGLDCMEGQIDCMKERVGLWMGGRADGRMDCGWMHRWIDKKVHRCGRTSTITLMDGRNAQNLALFHGWMRACVKDEVPHGFCLYIYVVDHTCARVWCMVRCSIW